MAIMRRTHTAATDILPTTINDVTPPNSGNLKRRISMTLNRSSRQCDNNGYHRISPDTSPERPISSPYKPYKGGKSSRSCSFLLSLLAIAGLSCALVYGKLQYDQVQDSLQSAQEFGIQMKESHIRLLAELEQAKTVKDTDSHWLEQLDGLRAETRSLEQQLDLTKQVKDDTKHELELTNSRYKQAMEKANHDLDNLHGSIQNMARTHVIEKFGPGPHYVQFEVDLHMGQRQYFTVQLASLDYMPTAVYYFLQQTARQLWDNTSFIMNVGHVLMARPTSGNGFVSKRGEFARTGLHQLPFQEYHEQQPHVKYTLGFSGKPAGPDFYINMVDNSIIHGPNGHQDSAEPCFGTIVVGLDVVDRMQGKPDEPVVPATFVDIVSVKLLRDLSEAVRGNAML